MRTFQFWILLLCSIFVSILYIKQIFLSRDLNLRQRDLVDSQQVINEGSQYENAWKQLAMHIYEVAHDDPALTGLLKSENVDVRPSDKSKAPAGTTPTTAPPMPSTPAKVAVPPVHAGSP